MWSSSRQTAHLIAFWSPLTHSFRSPTPDFPELRLHFCFDKTHGRLFGFSLTDTTQRSLLPSESPPFFVPLFFMFCIKSSRPWQDSLSFSQGTVLISFPARR
ncbi:hypothetical protein HDK77DRAFT_232995 [Phyllosticta capitalensis]